MTLRLGVLDQSPVVGGHTPAQAVAETVRLAQLAEELGYHRYWLAEHHAIAALADPCPEILLASVAGATSRMRVGTGGVLLPYYSPLKVAETFRMLEALHPGRIDLGVGRAPGGDQANTGPPTAFPSRCRTWPAFSTGPCRRGIPSRA
jgi:luciferase family oxidoreductase group 1